MDQHSSDTFGCCCSKSDCKHFIIFNESFKKVEYDAMLAAEIGQALLKETSDEEDSFVKYNTMKDNLVELKELRWEKEKSKGLINALQEEIKSLKEGMKKRNEELEKKNLCEKLLAIKTDIEEELKIQISDLKQEICQLRKSENNMRLKYKRLEQNYETLQLTHEELSKEHDILLDNISKRASNQAASSTTPHKYSKNVNNTDNNNDTALTCIPEPISNKANTTKFRASHIKCNKDPFEVLQSITQQTIEKINATDTRVLNRRLRRVFDMSELSDLSNSILNNILSDLTDFKSQFDWAHDYKERHLYFFPLVNSIQQLLQVIITNKITLNDLQADYVKRIERLTVAHHSSFTTQRITCYSPTTTLIANIQANNDRQKSFLQELFSLFIR